MGMEVKGEATILGIGTANPKNCVVQEDVPETYFRGTNTHHNNTPLKQLFTRICEKSMIKKRYMQLDEETLKQNPNLISGSAPSLDIRQELMVAALPKLAEKAASAAIKDWGGSASEITHLLFHSSTGTATMPGIDVSLVKSLGLRRSVQRLNLCHVGCHAGVALLRLAKDIAENFTHGPISGTARVLAVCAEITSVSAFCAISNNTAADRACVVGHAIFGDGAAAVIIGCPNSNSFSETSLFRIISASQTLLPNSTAAVSGHLTESGLRFGLSPDVPKLVGDSIESCLKTAFGPIGIEDWNSIFWASHPGGAAILREIEAAAGLGEDKLSATWRVLREFGNMSSCSVYFVLDEIRKWSEKEGKRTTGEGFDWGVLFGFGPGLTIETVVLRSVAIKYI